jgi:hypothetical protein
MKPPWFAAPLALGVLAVAATRTLAQPLFDCVDSIECTVANSDLVLVGKLVKFGEEGANDQGREATITVEESLKVPFRESYHERISVRLAYPESVLADWKDHSRRLLLVIRDESPRATVIDLTPENLEVLTENFKILRDPADVIQIVKETVERMPPAAKRIHTFKLLVPHDVFAKTRSAKYHGMFLKVPVDERLEKKACEYLDSDDYSRRHYGVEAMRYFKSDENIVRLKAALKDPGWSYLHQAEHNRGVEVRYYGVRRLAYRILKSWGIETQKPAFRVEIVKLDRVTLEDFSNRKQVTDRDIEALSRFENLHILFFSNSRVTDANLKAVAKLKGLRELHLDGTAVTDAGLKSLAELVQLQYLGLGGTKVTDAGLKELAEFKSLRGVNLRGASVTDDGIAELGKLRPELQIER